MWPQRGVCSSWRVALIRQAVGLQDPRRRSVFRHLERPFHDQLIHHPYANDNDEVRALEIFTDGSSTMTAEWPMQPIHSGWAAAWFGTTTAGDVVLLGVVAAPYVSEGVPGYLGVTRGTPPGMEARESSLPPT